MFRAWNGKAMEHGGFAIHATGGFDNISLLSNVTEDSPVMQYTGLKDKNGIKIWESDIVKPNPSHVENEGNYVIEWVHVSFMMQWNGRDFFMSKIAWDECEVIGNIYADKQLLE